MQQARPRAAFIHRVRTGADQEGALQGGDRAVDRPDRGEGPEIIARPVACAAMLDDLRRRMIGGDEDIRKRLVVAHQHVEARTQTLDQVRFQQKRFGFGPRGDEFDVMRGRDHPLDARVVACRPRIRCDALPDALGLADIEHVAGGIDHAIDAGRHRSVFRITLDRRAAGRERLRGAFAQLERLGVR